MDDKNMRYQTENNERPSSKKVWRTVGTLLLAIALAALTIITVNL